MENNYLIGSSALGREHLSVRNNVVTRHRQLKKELSLPSETLVQEILAESINYSDSDSEL